MVLPHPAIIIDQLLEEQQPSRRHTSTIKPKEGLRADLPLNIASTLDEPGACVLLPLLGGGIMQ